jgi:hypothetical protein
LVTGLTLVAGLTLFAGLKWRGGRGDASHGQLPADRGTASGDPAGATASQNGPFDERNSGGDEAHAGTAEKDGSKTAAPSELARALALARHSLQTLEKVKDYTCVFTKRELVGGAVSEEKDTMKLRHEPLSVYLRVMEPASSAGQEVIFVAGRNDGDLIAHTVGFGSNVIGRVSLDPEGMIAKRGNRYTIKDVGLKNLVKKLIDLGSRQELFRDSTVTIEQTDFAERPCTQVEISSPHPVGDFRLATARIVIDRDWDVPVHYEAYEWSADGAKPFLSETYSYYELHFDVGLTDRDFDPDNPDYSFP